MDNNALNMIMNLMFFFLSMAWRFWPLFLGISLADSASVEKNYILVVIYLIAGVAAQFAWQRLRSYFY